jgi:4-hydroxybutyrate CoA-transferase
VFKFVPHLYPGLTKAAAESAKIVAQINPKVPRTHGQSFVHLSTFDAIVDVDVPLSETTREAPNDVENKIGQHLAGLIPDRATLQMGIGAIPDPCKSQVLLH